MNLPNKLTVLRVILVPFFVAFLLLSKSSESLKWIALILFIAASLTDLLDGKIARKYNLVTTFGKFMDPLADKVLTISGMICLIELGRIPSWIVVIIVAREFIISGFRLIATEHGIVIAANYWGKWKTTFQMIMIILMIVNLPALAMVTQIVMWIALALTIISLITYIQQNMDVVRTMELK
ncbi:CDP-diacylglycerol--glycerol-3-phosphate 3-phosphatidyltransferase [Sarcina sp. DSM 11001]|uniref:CDP-diacylglycerol--glycerol-3-phosphate 3-phosphatidyltransferase n=1 Tax=Sarcina sp. DSM 11001 TaxID=1798184 RepID=UPI00088DD297|nr:CDP-diacylglycerol--glycerol-3-phosphate 3-phosphatidyltransferase [Sarcina sp. DSM 11001]SDK29579.1 CDP-diacylglycerol--glycerol-3-phosphate 3-phosphatidyltransferase [Sarcina sp. DSM 11001]